MAPSRTMLRRFIFVLALAGLLGIGGSPLEAKKPVEKGPDLAIDAARIAETAFTEWLTFDAADCAVVEGCVGGTGPRLLLRFELAPAPASQRTLRRQTRNASGTNDASTA